MGIFRAEAERYMHAVLQKAEESATDMGDKDSDEWELISAASEDAYSAASEDESDSEMADVSPSSASSGSKRKVDQMPGSSGTPGPPWKRTASGQNNNSHRQEEAIGTAVLPRYDGACAQTMKEKMCMTEF